MCGWGESWHAVQEGRCLGMGVKVGPKQIFHKINYRVIFLTGPPQFQYQKENRQSANHNLSYQQDSPKYLVLHTEGRITSDIRMQNKQIWGLRKLNNISGSARDTPLTFCISHFAKHLLLPGGIISVTNSIWFFGFPCGLVFISPTYNTVADLIFGHAFAMTQSQPCSSNLIWFQVWALHSICWKVVQ